MIIRKIWLPIFALLVLCEACSTANENCDPEREYYISIANRSIEANLDSTTMRTFVNIVEGDDLLFVYHHSAFQCDDIADDEWGEQIIFTIDPTISSFSITDHEIMNLNCYYHQFGAWVNGEQLAVHEGRIQGVKIGLGKWRITAEVTVSPSFPGEPPRTLSFDQTFD